MDNTRYNSEGESTESGEDSSGDGIPDNRALEYGLNPYHEHHPAFARAISIIIENDPEFGSDFVELMIVSDPSPVAVPFYNIPLLEDYTTIGERDPSIIPEINSQLLSTATMENISNQLAVLAEADRSFVSEMADEGRLNEYDWDNDGLKNWEEVEYGTSYVEPDSSGDGLYDGEAVRLSLDPTVQHERIGAVANEIRNGSDQLSETDLIYLRLIESNPNDIAEQILDRDYHKQGSITAEILEKVSDTDRDGLVSVNEREAGTDPDRPTTAGDGIPDGMKYRGETPAGHTLDDPHIAQKDLYVQVLYSPDEDRLTSSEKETLRDWWWDFGVDNPDGTSGINLHIEEGPNNGRLDEPPQQGNAIDYHKKYHNEEYMGDRNGIYYLLVFGELDDLENTDIAGQALSGGQTAVVEPNLPSRSKLQVMSHELLHNIVGRLESTFVSEEQMKCGFDFEPDNVHTCDGLLSVNNPNPSNEIVSGVEEQISKLGFRVSSQSDLVSPESGYSISDEINVGENTEWNIIN